MLQYDVITLFPNLFGEFTKESLIKRAQEGRHIGIDLHQLRDFADSKHNQVDDKPFGGGRGMVLQVEPIYKAVESIKKKKPARRGGGNSKVVLFSPRGKQFDQKMASQFAKLDQLIFICGRYEGVDERVAKKIADVELSIGDYVLMGGELPAMVVMEAVTRLIPGVLGNSDQLPERMTKAKGRGGKGFIEYPQYTRPEVFEPKKGEKWRVPKALVSGDHKKIAEWRKGKSRVIAK